MSVLVRIRILSLDGFSRSCRHVLRQQSGLALAGTLYSHSGPHLGLTSPPDQSHTECRIINRLAIAYAFRPWLRFRLTLGGFPFPRKPWAYGVRDSHPLYRYSYRHSHYHRPTPLLSVWLVYPVVRSPTAPYGARSFGATLSPDHHRCPFSRPVSYYALFKWWLLLSQHPGCHGKRTSLCTQRSLGALADGVGFFPFEHEH